MILLAEIQFSLVCYVLYVWIHIQLFIYCVLYAHLMA